jgi:septum site-determining protein MinC
MDQLAAQDFFCESAAFDLRGEAFALTTLALHDPDPRALAAGLAATPSLPRGGPVVLDLRACPPQATDPAALAEVLREHGFVPVGIRPCDPSIEELAYAAGLAKMTDAPLLDAAPSPLPRFDGRPPALLVARTVRSGQSIYAAGTDLIVLGQVSSGAEVLADGSIHVYGTLAGRALAGVADAPEARIFAACIDAEMLSIAGLYIAAEDIPAQWRGRRAQVFRRDGFLNFAALP